jgi:hypothetical protein
MTASPEALALAAEVHTRPDMIERFAARIDALCEARVGRERNRCTLIAARHEGSRVASYDWCQCALSIRDEIMEGLG